MIGLNMNDESFDLLLNKHYFLRLKHILHSTDYLANLQIQSKDWYRSGTVNLNTVNSKFHLIQSFCEIFARFILFHV